MEDAARCAAHGDGVAAGSRDVDGIGEPLAVANPADVVTTFSTDLDIDVLGAAVLTAGVAGRVVVVGDALAAVVKVFRAQRSGYVPGRAAVGLAAGLDGR